MLYFSLYVIVFFVYNFFRYVYRHEVKSLTSNLTMINSNNFKFKSPLKNFNVIFALSTDFRTSAIRLRSAGGRIDTMRAGWDLF